MVALHSYNDDSKKETHKRNFQMIVRVSIYVCISCTMLTHTYRYTPITFFSVRCQLSILSLLSISSQNRLISSFITCVCTQTSEWKFRWSTTHQTHTFCTLHCPKGLFPLFLSILHSWLFFSFRRCSCHRRSNQFTFHTWALEWNLKNFKRSVRRHWVLWRCWNIKKYSWKITTARGLCPYSKFSVNLNDCKLTNPSSAEFHESSWIRENFFIGTIFSN